MKHSINFLTILAVITFLPQVVSSQTIEIFFTKDTSDSALNEVVEFKAKETLFSIIKPLDLMNSKYGVNFTICTLGETGHPRYYSASLKPYNSWKTSRSERYKQVKIFLQRSYQYIDEVAKKKTDEKFSNIYRNIHHIFHVGFNQNVEKRYLIIWSDLIEHSAVDSWYQKYKRKPSKIIEDFNEIMKNFESDLKWISKPNNTEVYLISKGRSELSIMATRWWQRYIKSKGIDTYIKASF